MGWRVDGEPGSRHTRRTVRALRVFVALLLSVGLPFGQAVAPAHAHLDADHQVVRVHQHLASDHADGSHHGAETFDHAGEVSVIWLVSATLHQPAFQFAVSAVLIESRADGSDPPTCGCARRFDDPTPAHGPPDTPFSHRGPPPTPA